MKNKPTNAFDRFLRKWRVYGYSGIKGVYFIDGPYVAWMDLVKQFLQKTSRRSVKISIPTLADVACYQRQLSHIQSSREYYAWSRFFIKPTSEAVLYSSDFYRSKVASYRQLPYSILASQPVYRAEKRTTPLIRHNQIAGFVEYHHAAANAQDLDEIIRESLDNYTALLNYMRIPYRRMARPADDLFGGAKASYAFDTVVNGKRLQLCTVHNLDTAFSKAFELTYVSAYNRLQYVLQSSDGYSCQRVVYAALAYHYDADRDKLVLPMHLRRSCLVYDRGTSRNKAWQKIVDETSFDVTAVNRYLALDYVVYRLSEGNLRMLDRGSETTVAMPFDIARGVFEFERLPYADLYARHTDSVVNWGKDVDTGESVYGDAY